MARPNELRVCSNGHFITVMTHGPDFSIARSFEVNVDSKFCPSCGAAVLGACPACSAIIPARNIGGRVQTPRFCDQCGEPYPWTPRAEMIGKVSEAIENSDELGPADKALLKEGLEEIREAAADDDKQATWLQTLKEKAPGVWTTVWPIAEHLITEGAKKALGL